MPRRVVAILVAAAIAGCLSATTAPPMVIEARISYDLFGWSDSGVNTTFAVDGNVVSAVQLREKNTPLMTPKTRVDLVPGVHRLTLDDPHINLSYSADHALEKPAVLVTVAGPYGGPHTVTVKQYDSWPLFA